MSQDLLVQSSRVLGMCSSYYYRCVPIHEKEIAFVFKQPLCTRTRSLVHNVYHMICVRRHRKAISISFQFDVTCGRPRSELNFSEVFFFSEKQESVTHTHGDIDVDVRVRLQWLYAYIYKGQGTCHTMSVRPWETKGGRDGGSSSFSGTRRASRIPPYLVG